MFVIINLLDPKDKYKKKGSAITINTFVIVVILKDLLKNKAPVKERSSTWTPQV